REYPVLARRLTSAVTRWVDAGLEFLGRLCADWDSLLEAFSPADEPGLLVGVKGNAGDSHRGGRSVLIAEFASGFRLVYKPRSLSVDVHFQELLEWLERRGARPPLRRLKVIERGTHVWVEFVPARPCLSGLGAVAGQLAPGRAVKLEGTGTDEMRVARGQSELPDGLHRPRLGTEPANASDYGEEIVEGFAAMYRLLLGERENLLAEDGP